MREGGENGPGLLRGVFGIQLAEVLEAREGVQVERVIGFDVWFRMRADEDVELGRIAVVDSDALGGGILHREQRGQCGLPVALDVDTGYEHGVRADQPEKLRIDLGWESVVHREHGGKCKQDFHIWWDAPEWFGHMCRGKSSLAWFVGREK